MNSFNCDHAREPLQIGESTDQPASQLRPCRACRAPADSPPWLDRLLQDAVLVAPPPAVTARALRAALAAAPGPTPRVRPPLASTASPRAVPSLPLAAYGLAAFILALATGLFGPSPLAPLDLLAPAILTPLSLVLTSPAIWLLPPAAEVATQWAAWAGAIVLAWGLAVARPLPDQVRQDGH